MLSLALLQLIVIWLSGKLLTDLFRGSEIETSDVAALAAASIGVAWHRLLLRNERSLSRMYFRLDRLVWGYFAIALIALIPYLVTVVLSRRDQARVLVHWRCPLAFFHSDCNRRLSIAWPFARSTTLEPMPCSASTRWSA
jgi:hypothetical protein